MKCFSSELPIHKVEDIFEPNPIQIIARTSNQKKSLKDPQFQYKKEINETNKTLNYILKQKEWGSHTDIKFQNADVNRRVKEMFCEESNKLRKRKEKLRTLLRKEEYGYYNELNCLKENMEDGTYIKLKSKELLEKKESERVAFALKKYEQQFRNNCEELRINEYGFNCEMIAKQQREQMKEKTVLEKLKLEEEKAYLALWEADVNIKNKRDKEIAEKKRFQIEEAKCFLLKQMEDKKNVKKLLEKEKAKDLEQLINDLKEIEKEKLKEEENKRLKLRKNLDEMNNFIKLKRDINEAERLKELKYNEKINIQTVQIKLEREKAKENKKELKKIQDNYLQYNTYIKEQRLQQERRDDEIFHHEYMKYWNKWHDSSKSSEAAKKCKLHLMKEELKEKSNQKFEEKRIKRRGDPEERKILNEELQKELKKQEKAKKNEQLKNTDYYESLKCQIEFKKHQFENKIHEEARIDNDFKRAEKEYIKKIEDMKKKTQLPHVHPLRKHLIFPELSCKGLHAKPEDSCHYRSGTLN